MDPADYLDRHLKSWRTPVVVYRATAKYTEEELRDWIGSQDTANRLAVFVGASSREKRVTTTLRRAQQLRTEVGPDLLLGAVAIPERHTRKATSTLAWSPSRRPAAPTSSPRSFMTSTLPRIWCLTMPMSAATADSI